LIFNLQPSIFNGIVMAKYAVIDIGTNSIKFHIAAKDAAGQWSVVLDEANISRLGEGLQATGNISPEAMARNVQVVSDMAAQAREHGASQIVAVGTMCLRTAQNAPEFVKRVKDACDVCVEILPGEEEARWRIWRSNPASV
jgi:exopolyphosphatase/guanosine-5'-triphosphate,3'-diphosphate pyrophosphatase